METDRVAVLVDMENVPAVFIEPVADLADTFGRVCHLAVYADWRQPGNRAAWGTTLDLGGVPKQIMKVGGSNSADISIVVDAMELLLQASEIDVYVLATGDSDFVPLIQKLRARGKLVVGAAPEGHMVRPEHESAFDRFERLRQPGLEQPAAESRARLQSDSSRSPAVLTLEGTRKALVGILSREGAMMAGDLGNQLRDSLPGFDQRQLGFRRLSDLLRAQSDLLAVRTDGMALHVTLRGADGGATAPAPESPPATPANGPSLGHAEWSRVRDCLLAVLLASDAPPHLDDDELLSQMNALAARTEPAPPPPVSGAAILLHYPTCFTRGPDGTIAPAIGRSDAYRLRLGRVWEPLPREVLRRGLALLPALVGSEPVILEELTARLAESGNGELTQAQARGLVTLIRRADGWTAVPADDPRPFVSAKPWVRDPAQAEAKLDEAATSRMGPFLPVDAAAMRVALGLG